MTEFEEVPYLEKVVNMKCVQNNENDTGFSRKNWIFSSWSRILIVCWYCVEIKWEKRNEISDCVYSVITKKHLPLLLWQLKKEPSRVF